MSTHLTAAKEKITANLPASVHNDAGARLGHSIDLTTAHPHGYRSLSFLITVKLADVSHSATLSLHTPPFPIQPQN